MKQKTYGSNKRSYGVSVCEDGWIDVYVYHENQSVRRMLRRHTGDPKGLLGCSLGTSQAGVYMGHVIRDFRHYFAEGRVRIILQPGTPPRPSTLGDVPKQSVQCHTATTSEQGSSTCEELHRWFNSMQRLRFPYDEQQIPANGVYVLFEKGEDAHGCSRIVRVGTHDGDGKLPSRLREHYVTENKDRSIFRKHIGRALLRRNSDPFLEQWEWDLTSREKRERYEHRVDFDKQRIVERQVTEYIRTNFSFVVFRVDEKARRSHFEAKLLSAVSWCRECHPSSNWLGLHSTRPAIRESGLWNVQKLYGESLTEEEREELKRMARGTP